MSGPPVSGSAKGSRGTGSSESFAGCQGHFQLAYQTRSLSTSLTIEEYWKSTELIRALDHV